MISVENKHGDYISGIHASWYKTKAGLEFEFEFEFELIRIEISHNVIISDFKQN